MASPTDGFSPGAPSTRSACGAWQGGSPAVDVSGGEVEVAGWAAAVEGGEQGPAFEDRVLVVWRRGETVEESFGSVDSGSRPGMHGWGCRAQRRAERGEVVGVAGEDVVADAYGRDHEVGVDYVSCPGLSQELSDRAAIVERVDRDGLEERGEAGLT